MADPVNRTGSEEASGTAAGSSRRPSASPSEQSRKGALWRAVAGMAAALALACLIVTVEVSQRLADRTSHYLRRIAALSGKLRELKREAELQEKRLAMARNEIASRDRLKSILLAPDLQTVKLVPLLSGDSASATVGISRAVGGAVLNAAGLAAAPDGQVYAVWWMLKKRPPAKAAEFHVVQDGAPTAYLDLPPPEETVTACVVTLEAAAGGASPRGPVKLKGRVAALR